MHDKKWAKIVIMSMDAILRGFFEAHEKNVTIVL
jgi:hypothetical protein